MKSILINDIEPLVDIYGDAGENEPSTLLVSGWTQTSYTINNIDDEVLVYTVKIVKDDCEDLITTFNFTITPTPTITLTPSPTPLPDITWVGINGICEEKPSCPDGFTLSEGDYYCYGYTSIEPYENPSVMVNKYQGYYSQFGAKIYFLNGYTSSGQSLSGYNPTTVQTGIWKNGTEGRLTDVGLWTINNCESNINLNVAGFVGFTTTITVTEEKTYYVGLATNNVVRLKINGLPMIEQTTYNWWHIYPVVLQEGINYIEISGQDIFGGEIYDNTEAELIAATSETDLDIVFSTKDYFCQNVSTGDYYGYTCPSTYTLISEEGSNSCKKRVEQDPINLNTGYLSYAARKRLINGVEDGYQEDNTVTGGIGPYIPDVLNLSECPVGSIDPTPTPSPSYVPPTPTPTITPSPTLASISQCLIYSVEATVEGLVISSLDNVIVIDVMGLKGETYGAGGTHYCFNIASSQCRPCQTSSGNITFTKRGYTDEYELYYTITSGGAVYLEGELPEGFIYDGTITAFKNCDNGCLLEGTRITLADGSYKNIENLHEGDMLMSLHIDGLPVNQEESHLNWNTQTFVSHPSITVLKRIIKHKSKKLYTINNVISSTAEHIHFIKRNNVYMFERADNIVRGDFMLYEQGFFILVNSIVVTEGNFTTYNLDVEEDDVFYANGLLTHNKEDIIVATLTYRCEDHNNCTKQGYGRVILTFAEPTPYSMTLRVGFAYGPGQFGNKLFTGSGFIPAELQPAGYTADVQCTQGGIIEVPLGSTSYTTPAWWTCDGTTNTSALACQPCISGNVTIFFIKVEDRSVTLSITPPSGTSFIQVPSSP